MSSTFANPCRQSPQVAAYVMRVLPADEMTAFHTHVQTCPDCTQELGLLAPVARSLVFWPSDAVQAPASLRDRLTRRIGGMAADAPAAPRWDEPDWQEVAPGILCKLMATDTRAHRVSMMVRLQPGAEYPAHTHAGLEELFLLDGELWIDDRRLYPGDYNRAEAGTGDARVWSETGCTCVLITSTRDILQS